MKKTVKGILTFALSLMSMLYGFSGNATTDPTLSALEWKGSLGSVKVDSFRLVSDINYYANAAGIEKTFSFRNMVSLGIEESSPYYIQTDFTVSINLEITKTRPDNTDSVFQKILSVEYKKAEGQKFNALQYITFTNGAKVKVKIVSINTNGASWDVTKVLELKNELTATRDYVFTCGTFITGLSLAYENPSLVKQDEVKATWNDPQNGQTEYDLEWAWVEESAWPLFQSSGQFDPMKIFSEGATRVTVSQTSYKIPLLYDGKGKLFVRVRPAQIKHNGQRVEGVWSWTTSGTAGTLVAFDFNGHEENLNWQASTTFAEEGKRKTVIQYFDGTLRGRQTVTKDNTTLTTIVAETFYDYQGRPMIQVLPAPTINTIIEYAGNFNRFVNETGSPKSMYDKLNPGEGICIKPASALSNSSGTSNYYSPANAFLTLPNGDSRKAEHDKFIPDGEGYPFSETRYTPDATGRIATQSGVGPAFRLGSGHETKYFYESPDQNELDALFGTDAGYASHYAKNMVRDANGQYSVSYTDMHGRTVATALAGEAPANLQQLSSYNSRSITKNLLDNETNNVVGKSIISSKSIVVPQSGTYNFNYQLSPEKLSLLNCATPQASVCYDCLYELVFTIKSDCGELVSIPGKSNPYVVKNFTLDQYLSDCNSNNGRSPGFAETFAVPLTEGSYTITKELRLATEAQSFYRETVFKPANTCKTLQQFIDEEYQLLQSQTNCNLTCESCNTALGTFTQFRTRFIQQAGPFTAAELAALEPQILSSFNEAKANCDRICETTIDDGFDAIRAIREIMLTDVTPVTGQYAWMSSEDIVRKYNIFNTGDDNTYELLPQSPPDWHKPQQWNSTTNTLEAGTYKDENGNTDAVNTGLTNLTPEQFADAFKPSWAEALLPHHPEYCKLLTTERFLKPSYQFEAAMNKAATWQEAATAGYIQNLINLDPFFANPSSPGYAYRNTMLQKMQQFVSGNNCSNATVSASMWQVALASVFCQRKDPSCAVTDNQIICMLSQPSAPGNTAGAGCTTDWDYAWKNYRSIYTSQRKMFITQYLNSQCGNVNNIDLLSYNVYKLRFPDFGVNGAPQTEIGSVNDLFTQLNNGNTGGAGAAGNTVMQEQFDITCRSYATMWINRLKECPSTASAMTAADELWLIDNLVKICKAGSDIDHIQGSSSIPASAPAIPDPVYGVSYREFPDVVLKFLQLKGIAVSSLCHPWQIEFPKPYDKSPAMTNQQVITKPKDCECQQLSNLQFEYQQAGFAGSFRQWLEYRHGTFMTQGAIDTLSALCNNTYTCNFLPKPIVIPPVMQCRGSNQMPVKTCITCLEYGDIKTQFTAAFGSSAPMDNPLTEADLQLNHAFEQFANYKTGFSKHWSEYVAFGAQCDSSGLIPCASLDSVLHLFEVQYPNPGSNCQQLFTQFFNNAFGTFYTFDQIMNIYLQSCGSMPSVCKPKVDCKMLKGIIQDFFDLYGSTIYQNSNCENLFTAYVNQRLQSSYTYVELKNLYEYLCGCPLNICTFPNCFALSSVYTAFLQQYGPMIWSQGNCQALFGQYFNQYFGMAAGTYTQAMINNSFATCFVAGCGPDINQLCMPPFSCATLQQIVTDFMAQDTIQGDDCQQRFANYFNLRMNTSFAYLQIASIYQTVCGAMPAICTVSYDCSSLQQVMADFKSQVVYNSSNCQSLFTQYFNTHFGTSLTYQEITEVYQTYCEKMQMVCDEAIIITNCSQLQAVRSGFTNLYPDPGTQLGSQCQLTFRNYFNNYFNTNYSDSTIAAYYLTLCGELLNICATQCSGYSAFVSQFTTRYQGLTVPSAVKQQLFTYLFNKQYPPGASGGSVEGERSYATIKNMLLGCLGGNEPVPANGIGYSAYDADVLLSMKQVYYLLHPTGMPVDCETDFTSWFNLYMGTSFTYATLQTRYETVIGAGAGAICSVGGSSVETEIRGGGSTTPPAINPPLLCGLNDPIFTPIVVNDDPCKDLYKFAVYRGEERYELYIDSLRNVFDAAYLAKCLSAKSLESFTVTHAVSEYHYTLYYYDQAGQLVRTVPPEGVDAKHGDVTFLNNVKTARSQSAIGNWQTVVPNHTLATDYRYNTLGQVVKQKSPDAGISKFWYDRLGRLVVSQNAQQAIDGKYSYTLYDGLGRITEVGQKPHSEAMTQATSRSESALSIWLNSANNKEQITRTVYDIKYGEPGLPEFGTLFAQRNLRNRVSYTQVWNQSNDQYARFTSYYTYDIHGNVDTLMQDYGNSYYGNAMNSTGNRYKRIAYNYDLISGKVNQVIYQPTYYNNLSEEWKTPADQFYHKYEYDAENKLTTVWTSTDSWVWEKEARYSYYKHGALARVNLGQQQVQGMDYAYTLQGSIKGVNSTAVGDGTYDMGGDGRIGGTNSHVARDAFGFSLNYYSTTVNSIIVNDYKGIITNPFVLINNATATTGKHLFNGNIASSVINIPKLGEAKIYQYGYDQLNRLMAVDAFEGLNNASNSFVPVTLNDYKERLTYSANGNIQSYLRNGTASSLNLNNYSYTYSGGTNRLSSINNSVNAQTKSYSYDAIGNTTTDGMQGANNIVWNVYGKVQSLTNAQGQAVSYTYDAGGNRISKTVADMTEWYVKDASGNTLGTYTQNPAINGGNLTLTERYKYGASLLSINTRAINVQENTVTGFSNLERGHDGYLLTDHTGNTRVTITDRKLQYSTNGTTVDYYLAEVKTATYYSSYGAIAKSYNQPPIVAFNGQRKSIEIGTDAQTALYWEYNGDVGRRWNVDPVVKEYESTYMAFAGNPIWFSDPNGADTTFPVAGSGRNQSITLPEGISNIEVYYNKDYYLKDFGKRVNVSNNELRSFKHHFLGTFTARWNPGEGDVTPSFIGYKNEAGLSFNEAVDRYNANIAGQELTEWFEDPINQIQLIALPIAITQAKFNSGNPSAGNPSVVLRSEVGAVVKSEMGTFLSTLPTKTMPTGSFSITNFGWQGYPRGIPRPNGPFLLLQGEEYAVARTAANNANRTLSKELGFKGKFVDIHEITPVKFGGSPTNINNKMFLDRTFHQSHVTPFWNNIMKGIQ